MLNKIYNVIAGQLALLSSFSFILLSMAPANTVSADYYGDQYYEDNCCNNCCTSGPSWGSWIGAAALGAAAGAAAGAAVSSGRRGHRGSAGENGEAFTFARDAEGTCLVFHYTLNVTVALPGVTATPFVALPDGTVINGPSVPLILGINTFANITIPTPLFGQYEAGIQLSGGSLVGLSATPIIIVSACRDGSNTLLLNATPALALLGTSAQTTASFVYGNPPVP